MGTLTTGVRRSGTPRDPAALAIGLDIGATKTLGVATDRSGEVLGSVRLPTEPGAEGVLRTASAVVAQLRRETGAGGPVGVGVPGLVDADHGTVTHAVNLGLSGERLSLGAELAALVGSPVLVENDVNAAALGAVALSGEQDLVYLSIGTGLAAGLVLDGRLRRGEHAATGEVGHVPVDPRGEPCVCGQRGCLETVASGRALAAAWPSVDVPPAQALFAAAARGDAAARAVRDRFAAGVADAVRVLAMAVDPRLVVLGGGVAHVGEPLRASVAAALADQAAGSPFLASLGLADRLRVVPEHPVAAVGAAMLARDLVGGG